MREWFADCRPDNAVLILIDGHDLLAHHHAVPERHDTNAGFEARVGHKSGHQAGMKRTDVTKGSPHVCKSGFG